jgi:hypothetical protein
MINVHNLSITIVYQAYQKLIHHGVGIINPRIAMIALIAAGTILYMKSLESDIAKKYDLISLNLDAKNSIKNGIASLVGFGSVLDGYFGISYGFHTEYVNIRIHLFYGLYCV